MWSDDRKMEPCPTDLYFYLPFSFLFFQENLSLQVKWHFMHWLTGLLALTPGKCLLMESLLIWCSSWKISSRWNWKTSVRLLPPYEGEDLFHSPCFIPTGFLFILLFYNNVLPFVIAPFYSPNFHLIISLFEVFL